VAPAFAATPPAFPQNITVFPDRDFVVVDYPTREGQVATITVARAGAMIGRAQGTIASPGLDPVTGQPVPAMLEVNHPGGVCWGTGAGAPNVTPDILAGDEVTVAFNGAIADSSVTQSPKVTGMTKTTANTVIVDGTLGVAGGPVADTAQLEQRIVAPALTGTTVGRRDIRAGDSVPGSFTSDITFTATTFTATYTFDDPAVATLAAAGQARALTWMATDADANRQGVTIAELGEVGGPGDVGCPTGTATPAAPSTPVMGTATAGAASALVTWRMQAPGSQPITQHLVQVLDEANVQVGDLRPASARATSLLVTGLTNGQSYRFQVQAENSVGLSAFSAPSALVTPLTTPSAPVIETTTPGNASALVGWTEPDNGGTAITGYSVRAVDTATNAQIGALRPAAAGATSLNVTGLANGTAVRFQVQATNAQGTGAFSALSTAVTPVTVPGAPAIGTATRGNSSALVRWTAPDNGGSAITGYSVRVVNAANVQVGALRPAAAGATSLLVTGLVNGTAYRFQAQATSAVATGAFSAPSTAVTPATAPGTPRIGTASSGVAGGTINAVARWTAPAANGGAFINGYMVTALRMNAAGAVVGTVPWTVNSGSARALTMVLPAGNYRFVVRARNAVGLGANSARSNPVTAR
jgi:hypothetical protein